MSPTDMSAALLGGAGASPQSVSSPSSVSFGLEASPSPVSGISGGAAATALDTSAAAQDQADSPSLRPKYKAFSSLGMSGGLESLSAGFGGFSFAGRSGSNSLSGGVGGASGASGSDTAAPTPREEKSMVRLWEHQRYYPVVGWSSQMLPTDRGGRKGGWINEADIFSASSSGSLSFSAAAGSSGGACQPKDCLLYTSPSPRD